MALKIPFYFYGAHNCPNFISVVKRSVADIRPLHLLSACVWRKSGQLPSGLMILSRWSSDLNDVERQEVTSCPVVHPFFYRYASGYSVSSKKLQISLEFKIFRDVVLVKDFVQIYIFKSFFSPLMPTSKMHPSSYVRLYGKF